MLSVVYKMSVLGQYMSMDYLRAASGTGPVPAQVASNDEMQAVMRKKKEFSDHFFANRPVPDGWSDDKKKEYQKFVHAQEADAKRQVAQHKNERIKQFQQYIQENKTEGDLTAQEWKEFKDYQEKKIAETQKAKTMQRYAAFNRLGITKETCPQEDKNGYQEYLNNLKTKQEQEEKFKRYDNGLTVPPEDWAAYLKYQKNKNNKKKKQSKKENIGGNANAEKQNNGTKVVDVITHNNHGRQKHHPVSVQRNTFPKQADIDPGIPATVGPWKGKRPNNAAVYFPPTNDALSLTRSEFDHSISSADNPFHVD